MDSCGLLLMKSRAAPLSRRRRSRSLLDRRPPSPPPFPPRTLFPSPSSSLFRKDAALLLVCQNSPGSLYNQLGLSLPPTLALYIFPSSPITQPPRLTLPHPPPQLFNEARFLSFLLYSRIYTFPPEVRAPLSPTLNQTHPCGGGSAVAAFSFRHRRATNTIGFRTKTNHSGCLYGVFLPPLVDIRNQRKKKI